MKLSSDKHPIGTRFVEAIGYRGKGGTRENRVLEWTHSGLAVRLRVGGWVTDMPEVVDTLPSLPPNEWSPADSAPYDQWVRLLVDWGEIPGHPTVLTAMRNSDDDSWMYHHVLHYCKPVGWKPLEDE